VPDEQGAVGLRRLVWEAHEAALDSGYLPAQGWADLADQAWRLILVHPDQRAELTRHATDYAEHALKEAGPAHRRAHAALGSSSS
jgi:hypothetical protein